MACNPPNGEIIGKINAKEEIKRKKAWERDVKEMEYYRGKIAECDRYFELIRKAKEMTARIESLKRPDLTVTADDDDDEPKLDLDCKDMKESELETAFLENLNYLKGIQHGTIFSERHERFKDWSKRIRMGFNVSTIVFDQHQKMVLSTNLTKFFGDDIDYHMKVLLPEVCFKIFRDKFGMTAQRAYKYLSEERPIDKNLLKV